MESREIEQLVRMARAYAAEAIPWLAPALYAARLVLTEACPGLAAVDEGMRVYFNPRGVAELVKGEDRTQVVSELGFVWFHEVAHWLREHAQRAQEKNARPKLWNIASDLEINDARLPGLEPPRRFPPLVPDHFDLPEGKLAEFYYDRLCEWDEKSRSAVGLEQQSASSAQGERDEKSRSGAQAGKEPEAHEPECDEGSEVHGEHGREWVDVGCAPSDEGSGVHGERRSWELAEDDPQAPAPSAVERDMIRRAVAEALVREKHQGTIPMGWMRWAEEVLAPRVDWREVLKRRMRGAIVQGTGQRVDYSFARPHRRAYAYAPFLPPSLWGDFLPRVACVVDTSGSISEQELAHALAEVRAVLEHLRVPIQVIPCDAVPYEPIEVFTRSDLITRCRSLPGGGGTNMIAGIEAALQLRPTPDVVLVLTDGYTPYPPHPYHVSVLFGILAPLGRCDVPLPPIPPWQQSDVVYIEMP